MFGIIIRYDDKPDIFSYITDVKKIEGKEDIEDILKTAVYYVSGVVYSLHIEKSETHSCYKEHKLSSPIVRLVRGYGCLKVTLPYK